MRLQDPNPGAGRLWAASPPIADESRASWIQRLCGNHQYTFAQLTSVAGFKPPRLDWDKALLPSGWNRLQAMAGMDRDDLRYSTEWLARMSEDMGCEELLLSRDNKPCYRWCGACFKSDGIPHLRWHWRLAFVRMCWTHDSPLNEECAVCGHPFLVDHARLTNRHALTLAECPRCGCSLTDQERGASQFDWHEQRRYRKAIALCWGWYPQEGSDVPTATVGLDCEEDTGSGRRACAPAAASVLPLIARFPAKSENNVLVQLVRAFHSEDMAGGSHVTLRSKNKAKELAADEGARLRRISDQVEMMLDEEDRVRMREGGQYMFGIEPSVASTADGLPWHWALSPARRTWLARSLWGIRGRWRLIRSEAREGDQ
jgi:hypothetical protein